MQFAVADGEVITFGQKVTSGAGGSTSRLTNISQMSFGLFNLYSHIPSQRFPCSFEVGISQVGASTLSSNLRADES